MLNRIKIEKIDRAINRVLKDSVPGAQLLISEKGRVIYKKGYGFADMNTGRKVTTTTPFAIASVTKQFVATAIMILKERGLLNYDDKLSKYYPDYPDYIDKVTIRHMLTHTSGIKDYFPCEEMEKFIEKYGENVTENEMFDIIKNEKELDFEPGEKFKYSNSAYILLGGIIYKVTGKTFNNFIEEEFFKKFNMIDTISPKSSDIDLPELSKGYFINEFNEIVEEPFNNVALGWADGNVISNVEDLFKWHEALRKELILSNEVMKEAYEPVKLNNGLMSNYGFGWWINNRRGIKEVWHSGITMGYTLRYSRFIEEDIIVALITNLTFGRMHSAFNEIVEVLLEDKYSDIKYINLSKETLMEYTGNYKCNTSWCEVIYQPNINKLYIKCDNVNDALFIKGEFTLSAIDDKVFRLDSPDDFYLEFNPKKKKLTFIFNGHKEFYLK